MWDADTHSSLLDPDELTPGGGTELGEHFPRNWGWKGAEFVGAAEGSGAERTGQSLLSRAWAVPGGD